ncbi:hypothetical protein HELRODRAFT_190655 [Helobdella robusta]|uniref:SH3 domain-containing protein n=1 Tax=Helobdella robusta TaxID=6412 RepID=T1FS62_HELRO|nr:hypothetical protein HELRODRAFT_190655 [Helobdella robusta]ESO08895.1 hypothetical protein HELRODRAFT_190655 [Helobdella robusta]
MHFCAKGLTSIFPREIVSKNNSSYSSSNHNDMESEDNAESTFRHKLGLIPEEEEDLTEAFKARLGINKTDPLMNNDDNEINEIVVMNDVEKEATLSKFKFEKFIQENFKKGNSIAPTNHNNTNTPAVTTLSNQPLTESLLKSCEAQNLSQSAVVISNAIKLFCKDIKPFQKTPAIVNEPQTKEAKPGVKRFSMIKLFQNKNKSSSTSSSDEWSNNLEWQLNTIPDDDFEIMQFIICYGILNRVLRDEIYCQLCQQVSKNNRSEESVSSGWTLHTLCSGCFMPSKKLLRYYISFLNNFTNDTKWKDVSLQTKTLLHRTNMYGSRYHPPNSVEYQSVKSRKSIMLPVSLVDGMTLSIKSDSAMTASEMCHKISLAINLKDQFGFAVYISVEGKVSSLGNGLDHVMDAISECEQSLRIENKKDQTLKSGWHLFFGKELFTPWHDAEVDEKSTEIIYLQIIRSAMNGEFRFKSDEDLSRFVARRWYIENGREMNEKLLKSKLNDYLPKYIIKNLPNNENNWIQLIIQSFTKLGFNEEKIPRIQIKWSIVEGAQRKWPLQFAALFEAVKVAGPPVPNNELVIAISCRGVFMLEEPYKLINGVHYYEIIEVTCEKPTKDRGPCFNIMTIKGDNWSFVSPNAETITKLLCIFIDGLRKRSRWAVAIQEFILQDHSQSLLDSFHLVQGDVVELMDESEQKHLKDDWMYGKCERTNRCGSFPFDCIYIFPTSEKPPKAFLDIFSIMSKKDASTLPRKRATVVLGRDTLSKSKGFGVASLI